MAIEMGIVMRMEMYILVDFLPLKSKPKIVENQFVSC
jgi:hypothetical protein